MKLTLKLLMSTAMLIASGYGATAFAAATYNYQFGASSPLAEGNWVKVTVAETGVCEITYDELREMGFSNPQQVSVFGNGGAELPMNFVSFDGARNVEDNLQQCALMHRNNKIYFYARGTEVMNLRYGSISTPPYFQRTSKNIYTDVTHYFITDSKPVKNIEQLPMPDTAQAVERKYGYDYYLWEEDNLHNNTGFGQVFWAMNIADRPYTGFRFSLPFSYVDELVMMRADYAVGLQASQSGSLEVSFNNRTRSYSLARSATKVWEFSDSNHRLSTDRSNIIEFRTLNPDCSYIGLDYWHVSYPKILVNPQPGFRVIQERISFVPEDEQVISFPIPEGTIAWDITDKYNTKQLPAEDDKMYIDHKGNIKYTVVFDPQFSQNRISGYEPVSNTNLHALAEEGVDFLIFTMPRYKTYADEIADLHRKYDKIKVAVVTPDEVYNEFSSGNPDPMAMRMLAKMLYQNKQCPLKNVLFVGPFYADYRNVAAFKDRPTGFIGYQEPGDYIDDDGHASNVMDYYGYMTDYISNSARLDTTPMEVGVGVLPIYSDEEIARYVTKVREYITRDDFAWLVNETMSISCNGDNHIHDTQSSDLANLITDLYSSNFNSRPVHRFILPDNLGFNAAKRETTRAFNDGKLFSVYYGHATRYEFSSYYHTSDFMGLNNKDLGFMIFAGCDLTVPDKGLSGIGDMPVLGSDRALVGSICATRTVMSNFNYDLTHSITRSLFFNRDGNIRTETPTFGEVYALGKSRTENASEISYILIGDPALRIPVALRKATVNVPSGAFVAGDVIEVTGEVLGTDGNCDTAFNGEVVLKLAEPGQYVNFTNSQTQVLFDDQLVMSVRGQVKNGKYSVKLPIPDRCAAFVSDPDAEKSVNLPLYVGTYDSQKGLGASGFTRLVMGEKDAPHNPATVADEQAPAVNVEYDNTLRALRINVTDDTAIIAGIGGSAGATVSIDGVPVTLDGSHNGSSVTSYSATISVARLDEGLHYVTYAATDVAGNKLAQMTRQFRIEPVQPLSLSALNDVAVDEISFRISGYDASNTDALHLVVVAKDGTPVETTTVSGSLATCDTSRLPAGIYRAAVRHESPKGVTLNSNWVEFSVLD